MKKMLLLGFFCLFMFSMALNAQEGITGFWKSIDERSKKPQSIIAVYEYQGKYYGRIIATYNRQGIIDDSIYNPQGRAPGVVGHPYYSGMDIIWNLKDNGKKYSDGSILDPEKGNIYGAELWRQGNDLIVRGELLIFGRNQTWPAALDTDFPPGFQKPDLTSLVPVIPKVR